MVYAKRRHIPAGASLVLVTLDTFHFSQFSNIVVQGELVFGTGVADSVDQGAEGNDMQGASLRTGSVKESAGRLTRLGFEVAANIAAVLILFQVYKLVRKTFIQRGETLGYDHAYNVVDFEKRLHLFFELDLQRWVLDSTNWIKGFNYFYSYNMWIFLTCLSLMIVFAHDKYKFWRRVFFFSMLVALPWYALYPLAPPRFMSDIGFVDTLAVWAELLQGKQPDRFQPVRGDAEHALWLDADRRLHVDGDAEAVHRPFRLHLRRSARRIDVPDGDGDRQPLVD